MKNLLRKLKGALVKPTINDKLVVNPAPKEVAYFSYRGYAVAININDSTIDEVFDKAMTALKNTMEREEIIDDRSQRQNRSGETVRAEDSTDEESEPVAGDTPAGEVSSVLPEPKESDVR